MSGSYEPHAPCTGRRVPDTAPTTSHLVDVSQYGRPGVILVAVSSVDLRTVLLLDHLR
jgi:hypothetical protein